MGRGAVGRWLAAVLLSGAWGSEARSGTQTVEVVEDFEGEQGATWQRAAPAAVGKGAGASEAVFTKWGGFVLRVDRVPAEADGIAFWVRTDDGRSAALTLGLFEWEGKQQQEAMGARFWATPTWRKHTLPFAKLTRVWGRSGGNGKLDKEKVKTLQFQRLMWTGNGLRSERLAFDQVEFLRGTKRAAVERQPAPRAIRVDARKVVGKTRRFWRAISVADTVEQNTDFEGPPGEAMRIIGADRTFDYARVAWHVSPGPSRWVKYRYGKPIYRRDDAGRPVYDFTDQDILIGNVLKCGLRPMVLLHSLPQEMASDPATRTCPPRDYAEWQALVKAFVQHYAGKYGADEVAQWYWEIWNEPDLWWHNWKRQGKDAGKEAFDKLYDYAAAGITEVLPNARIGGPAIAGYPRDYVKHLAQHAAEGQNACTGRVGAPLAFLSHHGYSDPFGHMVKLYETKAILEQFGKGRDIEVLVTEYGNAIWGADAATRYQAASLCQALDAFRYAALVEGAPVAGLYWFGVIRAFSADCDAYFAPPNAKARYQATTLFLHVKGTVLAKPVYNVYRALNFLDGNWLAVSGAHLGETVHALATASDDRRRLSVLVYVHDPHDLRSEGPVEPVALSLENLPFEGNVRLAQYRIDSRHSDVFAAWRAEGAPPYTAITAEQIQRIKARDRLELAEPERTLTLGQDRSWSARLELEPHAIAVLVLTAQR